MQNVAGKVHDAIGGFLHRPKSAIAMLLAATAISGGVQGNANALPSELESYTAIETEVSSTEYQAWSPSAELQRSTPAERRKEHNKKLEAVELDNGSTIPEVIAAMDKANYEISTEFTPDGTKLYERTFFRGVKAPGRNGELKGVTGTIHIHNHPNNGCFSIQDLKSYVVTRPAQAVVITDKYAYILEPSEAGWPKTKDEAAELYQQASKEVDAKAAEIVDGISDNRVRSTVFTQKKLETLANNTGMKFTILKRRDEAGNYNPAVDRYFSQLTSAGEPAANNDNENNNDVEVGAETDVEMPPVVK